VIELRTRADGAFSLPNGDTYTDLGAIVTDNQGHDLGYKTFLDGSDGL
jgi:hypothetical protein